MFICCEPHRGPLLCGKMTLYPVPLLPGHGEPVALLPPSRVAPTQQVPPVLPNPSSSRHARSLVVPLSQKYPSLSVARPFDDTNIRPSVLFCRALRRSAPPSRQEEIIRPTERPHPINRGGDAASCVLAVFDHPNNFFGSLWPEAGITALVLPRRARLSHLRPL